MYMKNPSSGFRLEEEQLGRLIDRGQMVSTATVTKMIRSAASSRSNVEAAFARLDAR